MNIAEMVKIGRYAYAKEHSNGKWSIYLGELSNRPPNYVTGLYACRDTGPAALPLRFSSLELAKEYADLRAL